MPVYTWDTDRWVSPGQEDIIPGVPTFTLGTTEPDNTNAGPRVTEAQMSNYAGSLTNVSGTLDRVIITGGNVYNPQSNTIIRDSIIRMPAAPTTDTWGIVSWNGSANITVEYTKIEVPLANRSFHHQAAMHGSGFITYRNDISGFVDGYDMAGIGKKGSWTEEGSYIHDLPHYDNPPDTSHPDGSHSDGIQIMGNMIFAVIRGTAIHVGYTSGILVTEGIGALDAFTLEDVWFRSDIATFGSMLNFKFTETVPSSIIRPKFSKDGYPVVARIVMDTTQIAQSDITYNGATKPVWLDGDTSVVPIWTGSSNNSTYQGTL